LPIDLSDDDQVARIDVDAFCPAQIRQITALQVRLQSMPRHLGDAFEAVERPAPALVRMQAEVVEPSVDRVGGSVEVAGKFAAGDQSDTFTEIPVLEFAPGLLAPTYLDARRRPGLPKRLEVAQDGVERGIRTPARVSAYPLPVPAGEPVPFFGGKWSDIVVVIEAP
jgi:hypothetical protein